MRFLVVVAVAGVMSISLVAASSAASQPPVEPPSPLPAIPGLPALPPPLGPGAGATSSPAPPAPSSGTASVSASRADAATAASIASPLQRLVLAEMNVVRRANGRTRLTLSTQLTRAGIEHARTLALAGYFSHDWSDGTPFARWIRRFYPVGSARTWRAAENLAWSTPEVTARQAVEMWLASPEHRRILLDSRWKQVGLGAIRASNARGVYGDRDVVILAAEFGVRR